MNENRGIIAEWLEDLSTGNELIDNRKKELFRKINMFLVACCERDDGDEFADFLQFLKTYVTIHLLDEESFLMDYCYPLYRQHREEHDAFIHKLIALEEQSCKEGATACVIVSTGRLALDWVVDHVYGPDRRAAEFVRNRKDEREGCFRGAGVAVP